MKHAARPFNLRMDLLRCQAPKHGSEVQWREMFHGINWIGMYFWRSCFPLNFGIIWSILFDIWFGEVFGEIRAAKNSWFSFFQGFPGRDGGEKTYTTRKLWLWTVHNSFACAYLADARFYEDVTCMLKYVTHYTVDHKYHHSLAFYPNP